MKNPQINNNASSINVDESKKSLISKFKSEMILLFFPIVTLFVGTLAFFAYSYWSSIIAGFNATLAFTSSVAIPALSTFFMSAIGLYTGIGIALLLVGISSYFIYKLNTQKDTTASTEEGTTPTIEGAEEDTTASTEEGTTPTIDSTYSSNEWALVPYTPKHNNANHAADEIVVVNTINIQSIRETLSQFTTKVEKPLISEKPEDRVVIWQKPRNNDEKPITKINPKLIRGMVAITWVLNIISGVVERLVRPEESKELTRREKDPISTNDFKKPAAKPTVTQGSNNDKKDYSDLYEI